MDSIWTEEFYKETDAEKRMELLKQNTENDSSDVARFRENYGLPDMERKD